MDPRQNQWLQAIAKTALGIIGTAQGFHVWHSGGGCHHFRKVDDKYCYVLVCSEAEIPATDPGRWDIGLYDAEGQEVHVVEHHGDLLSALKASERLLSEV